MFKGKIETNTIAGGKEIIETWLDMYFKKKNLLFKEQK